MSGETEAEITEAQSHRVFHLKSTQWFRTTSAFSSSSSSSLVVLICSACRYIRVCVSVCCSSCELVSGVSTWMLKMWHSFSRSCFDGKVCVLGVQRCDKGVNKRIFWKVLNITAKLRQECFAENYRGIRTSLFCHHHHLKEYGWLHFCKLVITITHGAIGLVMKQNYTCNTPLYGSVYRCCQVDVTAAFKDNRTRPLLNSAKTDHFYAFAYNVYIYNMYLCYNCWPTCCG